MGLSPGGASMAQRPAFLAAASLVWLRKGTRLSSGHSADDEVLAAARKQVKLHSDDGDDFGLLIYLRPVQERHGQEAGSSRPSLDEQLEDVSARRGRLALRLRLRLRLRGGRPGAIWVPYHMRPGRYAGTGCARTGDGKRVRTSWLDDARLARRVLGSGHSKRRRLNFTAERA